MNALIYRAVLGAILLGLLASANAQDPQAPGPAEPKAAGHPPGEPPCGPPPEAYRACEGKNAGSRSEFVGPRGDVVRGACENEGNGKVVLRPDRPKGDVPGGHRGPPPEAYAACAGKVLGERSQFVSPHGDAVSGTCDKAGEVLVLRPDRIHEQGGADRPGE